MDIVFAVDQNYRPHVGAVVESILAYHANTSIHFWIVCSGRPRLAPPRTVALGHRALLTELDAVHGYEDYRISSDARKSYISNGMYLRLQIPDLLPASVKRVLYLDTDTLCVGPGLEDLFALDLNDSVLGAVRDPFTRRFADRGGLPGFENYPEIDMQAPYFNSGVLIIDTEAWRSASIREIAEEYLQMTPELRFPDQDALNVAAFGRWTRLSHRYNDIMSWRLEPSVGGTLEGTTLIHAAGQPKLWDANYPRGFRRELFEKFDRIASVHLHP